MCVLNVAIDDHDDKSKREKELMDNEKNDTPMTRGAIYIYYQDPVK